MTRPLLLALLLMTGCAAEPWRPCNRHGAFMVLHAQSWTKWAGKQEVRNGVSGCSGNCDCWEPAEVLMPKLAKPGTGAM